MVFFTGLFALGACDLSLYSCEEAWRLSDWDFC
jgi:hypothetical protein